MQDKSFTLTLFAHQSTFDSLDAQLATLDEDTANPVVYLFRKEFPDALALMGEEELLRSWRENPKDGLITVEVSYAMLMTVLEDRHADRTCFLTVQCTPYHYLDKALLIGDAAHAMVPFYGTSVRLFPVRLFPVSSSVRKLT